MEVKRWNSFHYESVSRLPEMLAITRLLRQVVIVICIIFICNANPIENHAESPARIETNTEKSGITRNGLTQLYNAEEAGQKLPTQVKTTETVGNGRDIAGGKEDVESDKADKGSKGDKGPNDYPDSEEESPDFDDEDFGNITLHFHRKEDGSVVSCFGMGMMYPPTQPTVIYEYYDDYGDEDDYGDDEEGKKKKKKKKRRRRLQRKRAKMKRNRRKMKRTRQ